MWGVRVNLVKIKKVITICKYLEQKPLLAYLTKYTLQLPRVCVHAHTIFAIAVITLPLHTHSHANLTLST